VKNIEATIVWLSCEGSAMIVVLKLKSSYVGIECCRVMFCEEGMAGVITKANYL
jgi:hypothetical protein